MMYGTTGGLSLEDGSGVAGEDTKRKGGDGAKGKRGARESCGGPRGRAGREMGRGRQRSERLRWPEDAEQIAEKEPAAAGGTRKGGIK